MFLTRMRRDLGLSKDHVGEHSMYETRRLAEQFEELGLEGSKLCA